MTQIQFPGHPVCFRRPAIISQPRPFHPGTERTRVQARAGLWSLAPWIPVRADGRSRVARRRQSLFRLRPRAGPRSCRSLGPELSLHAAPPPKPRTRSADRSTATASPLPVSSASDRVAVRSVDRGPGSNFRLATEDPRPVPGRARLFPRAFTLGRLPSRPHPDTDAYSASRKLRPCPDGMTSTAEQGIAPDRERSVHAPCNPRSGPLVPGCPPSGWTPPGGSGSAGRFTALDGQGGFPAGAGRAHGLDALEPDRAWAGAGFYAT